MPFMASSLCVSVDQWRWQTDVVGCTKC